MKRMLLQCMKPGVAYQKVSLTIVFLCGTLTFSSYAQGFGQPCGSCLMCDSGLVCNVFACECDNILPVELVHFQAKKTGRLVHITWVTASEENNHYFSLERSADGIHYLQLALLDGKGFSNTPSVYSFIDEEPFTGLNYYRLRQTDYNGKSKFYHPLTVFFESEVAIRITSYHSNALELSIGSTDEVVKKLLITDLSGKLLLTTTIQLTRGNNIIRVGLTHDRAASRMIMIALVDEKNSDIFSKKLLLPQ